MSTYVAVTDSARLAVSIVALGLGPDAVVRVSDAYGADRTVCNLIGTDLLLLDAADRESVLVSADMDDASLWGRATRLRCSHVAILPDAAAWVRDRLASA